jgi:hypothetical protein
MPNEVRGTSEAIVDPFLCVFETTSLIDVSALSFDSERSQESVLPVAAGSTR